MDDGSVWPATHRSLGLPAIPWASLPVPHGPAGPPVTDWNAGGVLKSYGSNNGSTSSKAHKLLPIPTPGWDSHPPPALNLWVPPWS
jgi:hypothetical protein